MSTRFLPARAKTGLPVLSAVVVAGLFAALAAISASAVTLHAADDFESGDLSGGLGWDDSSWASTGSAAVRHKEGPVQGSQHVRLRAAASITRALDVTGESQVSLSFWLKAKGFKEDGTSASVIVTPDGGSPVILETWVDEDDGDEDDEDDNEDGDDDDTYKQYTYDLDALGVTPTTLLTVQFVMDGQKNGEKIHIDDIQIFSNPLPTPTPTSTPGPTPPAGAITIDGEFGDWSGQAFISDPYDDQEGKEEYDLHEFYFANNLNEEVNYHMIKRHTKDGDPFVGKNGQKKNGKFILYIDGNNNGVFTDSSDRKVEIKHEPKKGGRVKVKVRNGDNNGVISDSGWNDWGETKAEGGLRLEFALDWDDLGISLGDVIRMYVVTYKGGLGNPKVRDRLPDSGDIQWSPASIFGPVLLAIVMGLGIMVIWWFRGRRLWISG